MPDERTCPTPRKVRYATADDAPTKATACICGGWHLAARRARTEGALFKRSDGVWIGRVELPPGPDGKRRPRTVSSKSYDVAVDRLRKLRNDVHEGRIAVTGSTTVAKWLDRWITEIHPNSARRPRPKTLQDYRTSIRTHIIPAIGAKRLDKLTTADVHKMHALIGRRRAAVKAHVVLQLALKSAIREGMITRNVAEDVDKQPYKKGKRTSLSIDVAKHIIATAIASHDESSATRWAAAFLTGARQGELLGLRWSYVDLDNGLMNLDWQLQTLTQSHGCGDRNSAGKYPCGKGGPGWCPKRHWNFSPDFEYEVLHRSLVLTKPKSEAGERWIPIVPPLLAMLRKISEQRGENPHDLVWHNYDGRPIQPRADYTAWKALLVEAKVITAEQTLTMHVARHTTATMLRAAGVDEQTRMEILGHASVDAQRIYAHADRAKHLDAMKTLEQLLA